MEKSDLLINANSKYDNIEGTSEIVEFFAGCNVFLTGGSGFVGKLLVEKLLRSCPKINKLYLLIREKKGKSCQERFDELFKDIVYDRLKREYPDFGAKVVMVEGGMTNAGLTLSPENREMLKDTNVVFHGAATVRFDDKLRFVIDINVRGTKNILTLCREMPNLKAMVYIGTAFSQCVSKFIDEVYFEPPISCDNILQLLEILNDDQLEAFTPSLLKTFPNTYAFSKIIAEDIILKYSKNLPVGIVRPSIMIPTEKEPIPAWINNIYGPTGVTFGAALGFLQSLHGDAEKVADIIPADYVINNIIAAAWDIGTTWQAKKKVEVLPLSSSEEVDINEEPPIFNCVTSVQNPITWGAYMKYTQDYGLSIPSSQAVWHYRFNLNKRLWVHNLNVFLFHIIPAVIIDSIAKLLGKDTKILATYRKIHKFSGVISYFCTQEWIFRNNNVQRLWHKLSSIDRKIFYFNVDAIRWDKYMYDHIHGIRLYITKDPLNTVPQAKRRQMKLKILHYFTIFILGSLLLWLIYLLFSGLHYLIMS